MQKTFSESSLAWWSMFVLWIVFVCVYTVFFSLPKNGESLALSSSEMIVSAQSLTDQPILPLQTALAIQEKSSSWTHEDEIGENSLLVPVMHTQNVSSKNKIPVSIDKTLWTPSHIVSTRQLFAPDDLLPIDTSSAGSKTYSVLQETEILYLEGTHHRAGVMKSAKYLGIDSSIQYILKNNDNTHFAYLGNELPDIVDKLTELWWKSIAFTEKSDIHTHWLFGDKIIFLLAPKYVWIKELFFVYFAEAGDRWFIQVDDDIFEANKPYLAELFTKRYSR